MNDNIIILVILFILVLLIILIVMYNNNNNNTDISTPPNFNSIPDSSLQLVNNTENELNVFLQLVTPYQNSNAWIITGTTNGCIVSEHFIPTSDAIGALSGQNISIPAGKWCNLKIPDFTKGVAFRIVPIVNINIDGKKTIISQYLQGAPSLIEIGKDMVGNMSIEDGTNYKIHQIMTIDNNAKTGINYEGNPCIFGKKGYYDFTNYFLPGTTPENLFGCLVGTSVGTFIDGKGPNDNPYYHLTGYLSEPRKTWCDQVHLNQCADRIECTSINNIINNATCKNCFKNGSTTQTDFTSYCYDFNDTTSQPYFRSPYKLQLIFSNLNNTPPSSITIPECEANECPINNYVVSTKKDGVAGCPANLSQTSGDILNICRKKSNLNVNDIPVCKTSTCSKDQYDVTYKNNLGETIKQCRGNPLPLQTTTDYTQCKNTSSPPPPGIEYCYNDPVLKNNQCPVNYYVCYNNQTNPNEWGCSSTPQSSGCMKQCHNVPRPPTIIEKSVM